jgi:hypothetical protein
VNLKSVYSALGPRSRRSSMPEAGDQRRVHPASVCIGGSACATAVRSSATPPRRVELAARNVRVNCVSPGYMRTPMSTGEHTRAPSGRTRRAARGFLRAGCRCSRVGSVDDIANAILFLASDEASASARPGDRGRRRVSRPMNYETILTRSRTAPPPYVQPPGCLNAVNLEMTGSCATHTRVPKPTTTCGPSSSPAPGVLLFRLGCGGVPPMERCRTRVVTCRTSASGARHRRRLHRSVPWRSRS